MKVSVFRVIQSMEEWIGVYENCILCYLLDSKLNRGAAVTRSRIPAEDEVTIGHSPDETRRDLKSTTDADNWRSDIKECMWKKWAMRIMVWW